jgi:hypothetical protein
MRRSIPAGLVAEGATVQAILATLQREFFAG